MQSILTWMHSVSTTGALVPVPATTSYLPRGFGQDKTQQQQQQQQQQQISSTATSTSSVWEGSGITYYAPQHQQQHNSSQIFASASPNSSPKNITQFQSHSHSQSTSFTNASLRFSSKDSSGNIYFLF